ncbi:DUF1576 domain-containing protein [Sellimonas sp.]|uniref:DUF1576 domain-containing protein n=1 Tax=Sellimonas sp. TaxID=2021466 RepID=UPI000B369359|nr:DUF1576 domain-containing protein [Sellimonas sp.]OUP02183.1 hypothetical protein B5F37_04845 [Drancourtella sp. An210]OUP64590.1 hypothetical protein B5F13_07630 [Drancourtella sp. An177]
MSKKLSFRRKYLLLSVIPVYFIIVGLLVQPFSDICSGFVRIVKEPDFLITDYFVIGGIGAAFLNAGSITLLLLFVLYRMKMEVDGHTITACCLIFGFSLFGKNVVNIWTILFGVFLYARYHRVSIKNYLYVGLYGTSLSPIITQLMQIGGLPLLPRLLLSVFVGIAIGFVLPPLSTHVHYSHKGYSLYNVGFSSGIIATVVISLFKSFGLEIDSRLIWYTGSNTFFTIILGVLFLGMIFAGFYYGGKDVGKSYLRILKCTGIGGTDYLKDEGEGPVLLNMGINGIFAVLCVLAVGGDLNGPTIGGIFTIVGFSATGKHLRNIVPIIIGVVIAGNTKTWSLNEPGPMLALLFSTTLAPIAGEFGILAGILAGFLQSSVALNVGIVYSGMNLYNNGFAGGLVAVFMVPVIKSIRDRRARAKGDLSL